MPASAGIINNCSSKPILPSYNNTNNSIPQYNNVNIAVNNPAINLPKTMVSNASTSSAASSGKQQKQKLNSQNSMIQDNRTGSVVQDHNNIISQRQSYQRQWLAMPQLVQQLLQENN